MFTFDNFHIQIWLTIVPNRTLVPQRTATFYVTGIKMWLSLVDGLSLCIQVIGHDGLGMKTNLFVI